MVLTIKCSFQFKLHSGHIEILPDDLITIVLILPDKLLNEIYLIKTDIIQNEFEHFIRLVARLDEA